MYINQMSYNANYHITDAIFMYMIDLYMDNYFQEQQATCWHLPVYTYTVKN